MARTRLVAFADTTSQEVYGSAAYLTGVYVTNFAGTSTDAWLNLVDGAYTAGTTALDMSIWIPWSQMDNQRTFRLNFPRIPFDTSIQAFYADTTAINASAWSSTGATGYEVVVYYVPIA